MMRRLIAVSASVLFVLLATTESLTAQEAPSTTGVQATGAAADAPAADGPAVTTVSRDDAVDAGTYGVRLRDLEQRINELKEQIFRSKARLALLAETILHGVVSGSQTTIVHENRMGASFTLVKVVYTLDGAPIFNKSDDEGSLNENQEFEIYAGSMVPGEHTLNVVLEYRGNGYGIFSYLRGYKFRSVATHTFTAAEGKATVLRVVGYEKGGPTTELGERPAIRFSERVSNTSSRTSASGQGGE